MRPAVVFDIDGTLANIEHRRGYVRSKPKNWAAFNNTMHLDTVYEDIRELFYMYADNPEYTVLIASGRGEEQRKVTEEWLFINGIKDYRKLYMRPAKDYRRDDIIKEEILAQMKLDGFDVKIAVDDRDQVVEMWRRNGIRCLQVAYGNF